MKFTLAWLKDHLETDRPLEEIVEKLSMIGLEVEGVEDRAAATGVVPCRSCRVRRETPRC